MTRYSLALALAAAWAFPKSPAAFSEMYESADVIVSGWFGELPLRDGEGNPDFHVVEVIKGSCNNRIVVPVERRDEPMAVAGRPTLLFLQVQDEGQYAIASVPFGITHYANGTELDAVVTLLRRLPAGLEEYLTGNVQALANWCLELMENEATRDAGILEITVRGPEDSRRFQVRRFLLSRYAPRLVHCLEAMAPSESALALAAVLVHQTSFEDPRIDEWLHRSIMSEEKPFAVSKLMELIVHRCPDARLKGLWRQYVSVKSNDERSACLIAFLGTLNSVRASGK